MFLLLKVATLETNPGHDVFPSDSYKVLQNQLISTTRAIKDQMGNLESHVQYLDKSVHEIHDVFNQMAALLTNFGNGANGKQGEWPKRDFYAQELSDIASSMFIHEITEDLMSL